MGIKIAKDAAAAMKVDDTSKWLGIWRERGVDAHRQRAGRTRQYIALDAANRNILHVYRQRQIKKGLTHLRGPQSRDIPNANCRHHIKKPLDVSVEDTMATLGERHDQATRVGYSPRPHVTDDDTRDAARLR